MASKLAIDSGRYGFWIGWWDDEDDMMAGDLRLGEVLPVSPKDSVEDQKGCEEHNFITDEVRKEVPPDYIDNEAFCWDTENRVKKALGVARRALKAFKSHYKKPWPEWALRAHAAGWRPPKGWKP